MDTSSVPAPERSEFSELRTRCEQLQQLVSSLLLILIVVSGTLSIFLLRQWRFVNAELAAMKPAAAQLMMEHTNTYAFTQDFVKKVAEYGRTHADFAPITAKYRLNESVASPGSVPVTSSLSSASKQAK
jgi:hypothetical protein